MHLSLIDHPDVLRADALACELHAGQFRADGSPYIEHPRAVMRLVATVPHTKEQLIAALLHDVVEDHFAGRRAIGIWTIGNQFGAEVAGLLDWLTDVSSPADGNRAARKALDREHAARAPAKAQTVRVADICVNLRDIEKLDVAFAKVYVPEKVQLLDVLSLADSTLMSRAREYCAMAQHFINGCRGD